MLRLKGVAKRNMK